MYFACTLCIFLCVFITHGSILSDLLFYDTRDTGMDFFHSIEYVRGRTPYKQFNTLYPPLANLFFLLLYRCVPTEDSQSWPATFHESIILRGTNADLRTYQAPMVLFIVHTVIALIITYILFYKVLKKQFTDKIAIPLAYAILMSSGMIYGIERGNIIVLIPALCTFYLLFYDSEKPLLREMALLSLAISAGLKLYPALLGIFLIKDRKKIGFGAIIRALVYGILTVILPCLAFREGFKAIPLWINCITEFQNGSTTAQWQGLGFNNIAISIYKFINKFADIQINIRMINIIKYIVVISLLVMSYVQPKKWLSVLSCTAAMTWYQSQSEYILCMYSIPLLFFFAESDNRGRIETIIFVLLSLITLPSVIPRNFIIDNSRYLVIQAIMLLQYIGLICICFKSVQYNNAH